LRRLDEGIGTRFRFGPGAWRVKGSDGYRIGLAVVALVAATAGCAANLHDVQAIPHLDERGRAAYRDFLAASSPRAFVIAPGGSWAWRAEMPSSDIALEAALQDCQRHTEQRCVPYAVDEAVVFDARAWVRSWGPYATKAQAARAAVGVKLGQRFPDLILTDPTGRPRKLSELRGKVVVVHFWGSWCPPCQHEMPDLLRLYRQFARSANVQFVFVPVREPLKQARAWLVARSLQVPLYHGGDASVQAGQFTLADGGRLPDRTLAKVFPTTYVLDRHGLVVFSHVGPVARWEEYAPFLRDVAARSGR